jgi:hypothetical protein
MLKFEDCTFSAAGANKKAKVFGLAVTGSEDVSIKNCTFDGTGYAAILNNGTGALTVEETEFHCDNIYNPIEGSQTIDNGNVTVDSCIFTGVPGNNFISFYQVAEDSVHAIKNCKFAGATNNNIIRLSNKKSATATFNISDCSYEYVSGKADEWTGFMLCQDYTNKSGVKQDFSKYNVNINNLTRPEEGSLVYVYEDGVGIIVSNYPAVTLDGSPVLFGGAGESMDEEEEN